jgi:hypothetical protein
MDLGLVQLETPLEFCVGSERGFYLRDLKPGAVEAGQLFRSRIHPNLWVVTLHLVERGLWRIKQMGEAFGVNMAFERMLLDPYAYEWMPLIRAAREPAPA